MSLVDHQNEQDTEASQGLENPDVIPKYKVAGEIANAALTACVELCVAGADVCTICDTIDRLIEEKAGKVYNKKEKGKKLEKGIAFPTCISVNEICGHYSPLEGESRLLESSDLVKIDLGCHIDGYICVVGHTLTVDASSTISGSKANAVQAAWLAAEAAIRLIKPGNKNIQVTKAIEKIANTYGCNPVNGVFSYEMKRHVIEGNKAIANRQNIEEKVETYEFAVNEVYGVDISISTGEGKVRETDLRTTVYKRALETNYTLKTALARSFITEINKRFPVLPFCLRALQSQKACRVGVTEAMRRNLLTPYVVLTEKPGEFIANFKFTILLLPGGTKKIAGLPFTQQSLFASELKLEDEELIKLLASPVAMKKKKKPSHAAAAESQSKEDADTVMPEDDSCNTTEGLTSELSPQAVSV